MVKLRTKHAGKIYYTVGGAAKVLRTNAVKVKELMVKGELEWQNFRVNGRLYMVKVTPFIGPPYYFVDRDGDGLLETRMNGRDTQIQVPGWVILSW